MRTLIIATALGTVSLAGIFAPTLADDMNGPSVSITSPAAGSTVTTTDIPVSVVVRNFKLECTDAGKPARPAQGHVHVMLDGTTMAALTNVACGQHLSIAGQGVTPGRHTISVVLASDDHLLASMPVSRSFDYRPEAARAIPTPIREGRPTISIVSPRDGEIVGKRFALVVRVQNLQLSQALEGKADVAGYGHLHVIVDQLGITDRRPHDMTMPMIGGMAAMKPMIGMISMPGTSTVHVDLSTWHSGAAHIMVMLATDDHMPAGTAAAAVTVRLR